ncbi:MAG: AAA family ATPase [Candidatus Hydrogenedentes bacterium]|nr:AAA family ATPase [Candidatus Hydrogenedentota bacterium]
MGNHADSAESSSLPLPPLLEEFRSALQDEIEAAKRNSNAAISLSNGHRIGQQASAHQYAFLIDSVLNAPDSSPADLIVPGRQRIEATIVSKEGLRLVISVESDLGEFVPEARLLTNLAFLLRKLIQRIESNAHADNPGASRMLGFSPVSGVPTKAKGLPKLNEEQLRALESALGRDLTVIWGPPGTGKTHTIGTIAEHLHESARTVLIVSHTNSAVDQAIKHVAKTMAEHLEQGVVVRVGQVKDDVLKDYPDVHVKRQVERRSRELVSRREELLSQNGVLTNNLNVTNRDISIISWLQSTQLEIASIERDVLTLHTQERELRSTEDLWTERETQRSGLLAFQERALGLLELRRKLVSCRERKGVLNRKLLSIESEYVEAQMRILEQDQRLEALPYLTSLRQERSRHPSSDEQKLTIQTLSARLTEADGHYRRVREDYSGALVLLERTRASGPVIRIWKGLPSPADQERVARGLFNKATAIEAELKAAQTAYENARSRLGRILELDAELVRYEGVGSLQEEEKRKRHLARVLRDIEDEKRKVESGIETVSDEMIELERVEAARTTEFGANVEQTLNAVSLQLRELNRLHECVRLLKSEIADKRESISRRLSRLLIQFRGWELISQLPNTVEGMMDSLRENRHALAVKYEGTDLPALERKADSLRSNIQRLAREISDLDERLGRVEHEVIVNASILGATLTKAYLSDDIQSRKFHTVILDEASMAPIPALWVAALLAENNVIIVGDFKQLPPIVLSTNELTIRWLGRDIFEASGLRDQWERHCAPEHFVPLWEQRRMVPEIAAVANLFYENQLRTAPEPPKGIDSFLDWFNPVWPQDSPVVLVDTGSLHAWVTSVMRRGNSSRVNFLSATVTVDLAEQLLRPDRRGRLEGAPTRIIIVSPYRAHANLVQILLEENAQLKEEVKSGTAHSFQGSESDAVIFDLVADEPQYRVNLFIPALDEQLMRLINVALTRARFRLFVVGNFSYCKSKGKNAFLGKTLLPFLLESFPRIDASRIVPEGLAARAAKAQMSMLGGEIEPDSERIVVTQADFYRVLHGDLSRAKHRIVIYSPFMTSDRVAFLLPQIQAAVQRRVSFFVITKSHSERKKSEHQEVRRIEAQLCQIGVFVLHKMRMHEKLVFIDDSITWSGSLNPLSFSNTQEIMERRRSRKVLEDYFRILRLDELISIIGRPESKCPICGAEMVAAEGADEPYYWRCISEECYTRGIDQPYPFDGVLTCGSPSCGGTVEFGYWGDWPHWRCTENNRHRQKVFKSHLRLPKMAALVPKGERRRLCKLLGIDDFEQYIARPTTGATREELQGDFFDDSGDE